MISLADQVEAYDNIINGPVLIRDATNVDFRNNIGMTQLTLDHDTVDVLIRSN